MSHQAPHDPYHLPKDWRNRHVGEYDKGWDMVRQERLKKQKELGIIPENTQLAERMWYVPDYSILAPAARAVIGKKMELYAGLVENLDYHIGRLIDHLKEIGEYENTIFIVFGDNGAEGTDLGAMIGGTPGTLNYLYFAIQMVQQRSQCMGRTELLRGLWSRLGTGFYDTFQPIQRLDGRRRHKECIGSKWSDQQTAEGQHQPWHHVRGRHYADLA
ncbi:MAG: sulfatase-like hydrolase/transferase [Marinilabiliales bacterium]|nr:sulfatase-like hydrolase/transferase [Marinilabiliales bacterium]